MNPRDWKRKRRLPAGLVLGLTVWAGCGGSAGPTRYDLSGTVTYQGKQVPAGMIVLTPDADQGNSGPGTSAPIESGRYQTPPGRGAVGGPHVATITGYDGVPFQDGLVKNPLGKPLFGPIEIKVDLPKQATEHDFVVPDDAP